jgi:magnesium chelatase subunit I
VPSFIDELLKEMEKKKAKEAAAAAPPEEKPKIKAEEEAERRRKEELEKARKVREELAKKIKKREREKAPAVPTAPPEPPKPRAPPAELKEYVKEKVKPEDIEARRKAEEERIAELKDMIKRMGVGIERGMEALKAEGEKPAVLKKEEEMAEELKKPPAAEIPEEKRVVAGEVSEEGEVAEAVVKVPEAEIASICPLCGAGVGLESNICANCGTEFVEDECRCAFCNAVINARDTTCSECGKYLAPMSATCPMCGGTSDALAPSCEFCGAEFADEEYRCGMCGASLTVDAVKCDKCGTIFPEGKPSEEEIEAYEEAAKAAPGAAPGEGTKTKRVLFPFSAVVGQEMMRLALILNAIDQEIGGVLAQGQKGTGKSVSVRGLTEILPPIDVVEGCRFNCDPDVPDKWCWECKERFPHQDPSKVPRYSRPIKVVDLPLNATEDRVVGTIDVEKILKEGLRAFEQGILADANRGVLYVDEINLLDDYIVDVLLDAAAMGIVTVEREAVSVSYPSKFIIVGTMNPEEGGLRPQLLDRIALNVPIKGLPSIEDRMEVVKRRDEFLRDPDAFRAKWEPKQNELREKIMKARELLPSVEIPRNLLELVTKISISFGVDGHRADLIIERTAKAIAAWEGRKTVTLEDVIKASEYALPHRMRKRPFEEEEFSTERLRRVIEEIS